MRRALALARRGWGAAAPNPMVGAVIVRDGEPVGEGFHAGYGKAHAEAVALQSAGNAARGSTMYVTLEPCDHQGHTPPCSRAIIDAGVRRVVIAARDPNPEASGGAKRLSDSGVAVEFGMEEARATELNAAFFNRFRSPRPWVVLKLAMSLDGAISDAKRNAGWLTSEASRRVVHHMRAGADGIAVGLGTVIADDPMLTVRGKVKPRVPPARIVFARDGLLPAGSRLARTAREVPTWLVTSAGGSPELAQLREMGVKVIQAHTLDDGLRLIASEGVRSLLVEGGAVLASALLHGGFVNRLAIFRAPVVLGAEALGAFSKVPGIPLAEAARFSIVESRTIGNDVMTTYAVTPI